MFTMLGVKIEHWSEPGVQKGWVKLFPVALKLREAVKIIMTRIYARYEMHLKVLLPYCCVFVSALQVTQCIKTVFRYRKIAENTVQIAKICKVQTI